jgi:hypothetical protein
MIRVDTSTWVLVKLDFANHQLGCKANINSQALQLNIGTSEFIAGHTNSTQ